MSATATKNQRILKKSKLSFFYHILTLQKKEFIEQEKGGRKDLEWGLGEMEGKGMKRYPDPLELYFVKSHI